MHERVVAAPAPAVGALLDGLGGDPDLLWPGNDWPPLRLDGPLASGASGGHGPMCYAVTTYEPRRRVRFGFLPGCALVGYHAVVARCVHRGSARQRRAGGGGPLAPSRAAAVGARPAVGLPPHIHLRDVDQPRRAGPGGQLPPEVPPDRAIPDLRLKRRYLFYGFPPDML